MNANMRYSALFPHNPQRPCTSISGGTGYFPAYSSSSDGSDASIREGIHGLFSDNRITFSGSLLHVGTNTITINMRKGGYFANHAMYDYIRL